MKGRLGFLCQLVVAAYASALLAAAGSANALTLEQIGGFSAPVFVTSEPDDHERLFVVERRGTIKLVADGRFATFLDIRDLVRGPGDAGAGGEQGLFSVAFPPDFDQTQRFYVDYTGQDGPGNLHIDEFTASGNSANPATRRSVLTIDHSNATNHNGGQLQFGPDGYLYVSTGDGGAGQSANGQSLDTLLGKILRIDPRQANGSPYSILADNPFVGAAGMDEIWSYGLRNPWRFSFDLGTGDILIGDVGAGRWEEIDYAPASAGTGNGANFGWNCREGRHQLRACSGDFVDPIFEYPNPPDGGAAVTGGYVSRDPGAPELEGRYLWADFFAGDIRSFVPALPDALDDRSEGLPHVPNLASFGQDTCGRNYVVSITGPVYRLVGSEGAVCVPPTATARPQVSGMLQPGETLSTTTGTWTGNPFSFATRWRRCEADGTNCLTIAGADADSYELTADDVGHRIRVKVIATNAVGTGTRHSLATGLVGLPKATSQPQISGVERAGHTLTATTGTWTGDPTSFAYQWMRCDAANTNCVPVGADADSYELTPADVGSRVKVRVTATNRVGTAARNSRPTTVIAAAA